MQINTVNIKQNAIVLANATALAVAVITELGERDISRTLGNESLSRDNLEHLVVSQLSACLSTPA